MSENAITVYKCTDCSGESEPCILRIVSGSVSMHPHRCPYGQSASWKLTEEKSEPVIVESNEPCDYCTGALNRKQCESCDKLSMDCFVGRRLGKL